MEKKLKFFHVWFFVSYIIGEMFCWSDLTPRNLHFPCYYYSTVMIGAPFSWLAVFSLVRGIQFWFLPVSIQTWDTFHSLYASSLEWWVNKFQQLKNFFGGWLDGKRVVSLGWVSGFLEIAIKIFTLQLGFVSLFICRLKDVASCIIFHLRF